MAETLQEETKQTKRKTVEEIASMVEYLDNHGYLKPGSIIPEWVIERCVGTTMKKAEEAGRVWDFLTPFLMLREEIELQGYFLSQKGCEEGSIRILELAEMAEHCKRKLTALGRKVSKTMTIMKRASVDDLSRSERRNHDFELQRISFIYSEFDTAFKMGKDE